MFQVKLDIAKTWYSLKNKLLLVLMVKPSGNVVFSISS